jgi:hypothetical protein
MYCIKNYVRQKVKEVEKTDTLTSMAEDFFYSTLCKT